MSSTVMQYRHTLEEKRERLGRLANIPAFSDPSWPAAAEQFVENYAPLRPHPDNRMVEQQEVPEYARRVSKAWKAKSEVEMRVLNRCVEEIFEAGDPVKGERPVIRANFLAGEWEPVPRTLLDVLAVQLMRDRKMLHRW